MLKEWIINKPIAHRGLHNKNIPENSLAAFENASKSGYAIELDVQLSADGIPMVFHDDNTLRLCGINKSFSRQTANELKGLKLLNTNQHIPGLSEVLSIIDGKTPILIELKNRENNPELAIATAGLIADYKGELAIMSFNPYTVGWFAKNMPNIPRGQLSTDFKDENLSVYKKFLLKHLLMNYISRPDFVAFDIDVLPTVATTLLKKWGMPILSWTINNRHKVQKARKYAGNIIFENLDSSEVELFGYK